MTRSGKIYNVDTIDNPIYPETDEELLRPGQKLCRSGKMHDLHLRNNSRQKMKILRANRIKQAGKDVWQVSLAV